MKYWTVRSQTTGKRAESIITVGLDKRKRVTAIHCFLHKSNAHALARHLNKYSDDKTWKVELFHIAT